MASYDRTSAHACHPLTPCCVELYDDSHTSHTAIHSRQSRVSVSYDPLGPIDAPHDATRRWHDVLSGDIRDGQRAADDATPRTNSVI
jgi:hypothetical protein